MIRALLLTMLVTLPALAAPPFCVDKPEPNAKPDFSALIAVGTPDPIQHAKGWVWVNLWATWCGPCVAELGALQAIQASLGGSKTVRLALVSMDQDLAPIAPFLKRHTLAGSWHAPLGEVRSRFIQSLGLVGGSLPTHVLIDPKGAVRCVHEGAVELSMLPAIRARLGLQ